MCYLGATQDEFHSAFYCAGGVTLECLLLSLEEIYSALVKGDTLKWLFKQDVLSWLYFVRQSIISLTCELGCYSPSYDLALNIKTVLSCVHSSLQCQSLIRLQEAQFKPNRWFANRHRFYDSYNANDGTGL